MLTYDATTVDLFVYTFKSGLLSAVAHDLKIKATSLKLTLEGSAGDVQAVQLSVDPTALRVVCAMRNGEEAPDVLSEADRGKIERALRDEVLETRRYASIRFRSDSILRRVGGQRVAGELTLHGLSRRIEAPIDDLGSAWTSEVRLHQPDFRIEPYTAMLGTLKVAPHVKVVLRVPKEPAPRAEGDA